MRWIAFLTAALAGSAALFLLLVAPPASAQPVSAASVVGTSLDKALDKATSRSVQPVSGNGHKSRWRHCPR